MSIIRDITEKKKDEEKIRASEEDFKRLFENVGVGVYISSKEGRFLDANKALLDMLGYDNKSEFYEIDLAKDLYLRPEDRRTVQDMIEGDGKVNPKTLPGEVLNTWNQAVWGGWYAFVH